MAAVSERNRLKQLADFDYVVLVGDRTEGEVENGNVVRGSKTSILYSALTTVAFSCLLQFALIAVQHAFQASAYSPCVGRRF